jgi:hypothetical protein
VGGAGAGVNDSAGIVAAGTGRAAAAAAGAIEGPSVPGPLAGTDVPGLGGSEGCIGDPVIG